MSGRIAVCEVVDAEVVDRALEQRGVGAPDGVPDRREDVSGPGEEVAALALHVVVGEGDEQRADQRARARPRRTEMTALPGGDLAQRLAPAVVVRRRPASRAPAPRVQASWGWGRARWWGTSCDSPFRTLAGHHQAEHLARGVARHDADDPAAVHAPRCGRRARRPRRARWRRRSRGRRVAGRDDPLVDELDRADVDAAGRLGGDEQPQVAAAARGRARPSAGCRRRGARRGWRCPARGRRTR